MTVPNKAMKTRWTYRLGDLLAGAIVGVSVILACQMFVPESLSVIGSIAIGMVVGMTAQMMVSALLGSLLGQMEMMVPGMFVGMLGMFLPMLPLQNPRTELIAGGVLGFVVFGLFTLWDERKQGAKLSLSTARALRIDVPKSAGGFKGMNWIYDLLEKSGDRRHAAFQQQLFQKMTGRILFVAAGTGLNFAHFPPGKEIVAIDISPAMLSAATFRAAKYHGRLNLQQADAQKLTFLDESFDCAATASTFCSVPDPILGLGELYRVLKPGGKLLMFEHVRSRNPLVGFELDLLTLLTRRFGPAMNRDTIGYVQHAGFAVDRVVCTYLDIFVAIEAHRPLLDVERRPGCPN